jgi:hypothetical protein
MSCFAIIETEEGLTLTQVPPHGSPEEAAALVGARLVDPGPYPSYEEAYDALMAIPNQVTDESD